MNVPDWLWQNIEGVAAVLAIVHYTIKAARWAVTKYGESRAMQDKPTLTAGTQAQILYDVRALAGTERQILYNVEAPKPSLARRLQELASWYLYVS
jgi:hypothetical protein